MGMNRRKMVQSGTAAAVGATLPALAVGANNQDDAFEASFLDTLTQLRAVFAGLGFAERNPLSIATGDERYNGGLRHDFDQSDLPSGGFVIQPLARVAGVDEKTRPDVLPLFHEVGCHPSGEITGQDATLLMLRVLVEDFGLNPARLAFVSVPQSDQMRSVFDKSGLPFDQKVFLRNELEALAAQDASGYFFPDPFGDAYVLTMGVYYQVGDTNEPAPEIYPPSDHWTEIGEIVLGNDITPPGLSIGAERLTYAVSGQFPTWDERLQALFAEVEQDGAEPPGLLAFR
ncbi:MAG: hypothetical protein AAFX90_04080 [Pseudomonadota bacterium]